MKHRISLIVCIAALFVAFSSGCTSPSVAESVPEAERSRLALSSYSDGIYRGFYIDGGIEQLSVEFALKDNAFVFVRYQSINYKDGNYLGENATNIQSQVASQFQEAATYLVGKPVDIIPEILDSDLVVSDRDAVTSATLRTGKLASALMDGLSRGVFRTTDTTVLSVPETAPDGGYIGFYYDGAQEEVSVEFTLHDNCFTQVCLLTPDADTAPDAAKRYTALLNGFSGQPLTAIADLYGSGGDNASLHGKLASAMMNALSRGVFQPSASTVFPSLSGYANGTYRGFFYEGGIEQVSVQFELVNDTFASVKYRGLGYTDGDYLDDDATVEQSTVTREYLALARRLEGRTVGSIYDLFQPAEDETEVDAVSGATCAANKLVSALMDGLNRGVYRMTDAD